MPRSWSVTGALVALAVVFAIAGVLYQTGNLQIGTSADGTHAKHALLSYVLAVAALIAANFARPRRVGQEGSSSSY